MSAAPQKALDPGPARRLDGLSLLDDKVLAMIVGRSPLARTLETLCLEIQTHDPGLLCSILLLDPDGVTLRSGAAPSFPAEYTRAIDGIKAGPSAGSCGTAIYRKQPVVVSDIATDPLWEGCRQFALPYGLQACWSTPIASQDGTLLGTFAIYYREARMPNAQHLQLIAHAAHLAALAIERDRDKTELRAAEDRYRTLVERLPAITYVAELGAAGPWHYVSPQIQSILGFSPEEWLADSLNWMDHIHPDDRETAFAAELDFMRNRELFKAEYRMFAADGRVLWFRDEGVLLQPSDQQALLMQGVLYDITEHKRLEEQLRHSQKMEAVGQLAAGIAHDFNNLLMLIQAHNERLRGHLAASDPAREDSLEIEEAVNRAAAVTNQLLAFSRRQLLQLQVLDLNNALIETATMLERLMPPGIELRVLTADSPQFVKADPTQLAQVILNLAVNARDAMPEGGRLSIQTRGVELAQERVASHGVIPPGRYAMLSVSDTGGGMHSDIQARMFEPFFTTKLPGKGTGLGLAIVYGVVKQTGGWIAVNSCPGEGTSFEIYIPRSEESSVEVVRKAHAPAPAALSTGTILLVEDQEGIRDLVQEFLRRKGYSVLCAADGNEALRAASTYPGSIDLIVTDVIMPSMGGIELAQRMAAARPEAKILFMSGNLDQASLTEQLGDAHAPVLQKPFPLDTLLRKVRSVLEH